MIIKNGLVYTKDFVFEQKDILVEDGTIKKVADCGKLNIQDSEIIDASNLKIIPGLTDIHFHGCVGHDFCDGTSEAIREMAKYQRSVGVTSICPATMTLPIETVQHIIDVAVNYEAGEGEADLIGINLEGPFISPKRCGAQNPAYVHPMDEEVLSKLINTSNGLVKLVTIAPEEDGAIQCISHLSSYVNLSVGHTVAGYDEAKAAFDNGANHVTHLFNAMPPFTHREPGPIAAAVENKDVMVELIGDGIHSHPATVRLAFHMFGDDRMILISDSTMACGMEEGQYELGGLPVFLKDGAVRLEDGTLAGSGTNLFDCMVNVMKMGVSEESAIKAATFNPVKSIGMEKELGTIEEGKKAKLVIVDNDYQIKKVI